MWQENDLLLGDTSATLGSEPMDSCRCLAYLQRLLGFLPRHFRALYAVRLASHHRKVNLIKIIPTK